MYLHLLTYSKEFNFTIRYKDNVLIKEDERHTFYADEEGFFALTIDPVQTGDTGRYTCVATNEAINILIKMP
jgi:hypothetical protein